MKKVFLILCLFGIILPYYQLILFILGGGSFEQFWTEAFASYPSSMLAMDLSVAALAFIFNFERVQADKTAAIYKVCCLSFWLVFL